ncbi:glycoside hydrolase family 2 protein [Zobellia alginiliquefaciens]|uniref:glycoside hydrolase family 2 protein n=1 Tax=Zobellia alginiliquefaciens TaxID=3032586 RepID=UPI0023E453FD|nr:sugar-binding domain-containing protein [Zobellia alginiliquefaciens]
MHNKLIVKSILITLLFHLTAHAQQTTLPEGFEKTDRTKLNINQGWKFHLGHPDADFFKTDVDDSSWETVNVPHGLELTTMDLNGVQDDKYQDTFMRKVGWYRKEIEVSDNSQSKVFLEFEGVHQVTDVWVNGKHIGQHAVGGYTPFHFDITDFVNRDAKNLVTVLADNRKREDVPPDPGPMDYIKFAGLYRDVYLVETNPLHITFNWEAENAGQYITTPTVDPVNMNATINIKTTVRNENNQPKITTVINRVVDDKGLVVLKLEQTKTIASGADVQFNVIGSIEDNLKLWSIDEPNLYRVNTLVLEADKVVDQIEVKTGFRKIEMNNHDGIVLNGKPLKLIGTNLHQHYGFIGDAMPNSLHYKDILQLKKLGMNVIRTAHYPHDNSLLEACDELGMLVYEEAPTWMSIGNEAWFDNFEKSARAMVRNHRNHTSVFIWGAGINHRGYVPRAHNVIKQEDPVRYTASQSSRWTGWQTSGLTDIYGQMVYGPYYWSGDEPMVAMEGRRGPEAVNEYMNDPMKLGLISWTAHAYYTFHPTKTPKNRSRGGFMTAFRYPRPEENLAWYPAELTDYPYLHIASDWNEDTKEVVIFSNSEKVQLKVNGKTIAEEHPSRADKYKYLKHAPFVFSISKYEKGTLTANGLLDGKIVVSETTKTPEEAYRIILEPDMKGRKFVADGSDILVAYAKIVDKNGILLGDADVAVEFSVKGDAEIIGDKEGIGSNPMQTEYGVAPVLIRAGNSPGQITITAKAKGLKSATETVTTEKANFDMITSTAEPIYDFESIRVDLGGDEQLVQFDWIPWNGKDNAASTKQFEELGGFSATVQSNGDASSTRWLGEINVIGKYGFAHGEGVLGVSKEGLTLKFSGLKKGKYKLNTVHHAPRTNTDSMDPNQEKMATYRIYKIPYTKELDVTISDANGTSTLSNVTVTEGETMQTSPFQPTEIYFESDGKSNIQFIFKGTDQKAVWLNSFVLSEWH